MRAALCMPLGPLAYSARDTGRIAGRPGIRGFDCESDSRRLTTGSNKTIDFIRSVRGQFFTRQPKVFGVAPT